MRRAVRIENAVIYIAVTLRVEQDPSAMGPKG